jgi:hypothetical protein
MRSFITVGIAVVLNTAPALAATISFSDLLARRGGYSETNSGERKG